MRLRIFALVLSVLATGCSAPEDSWSRSEAGACNDAIFEAAQYARGLASQRQEMMKVIRFASEAAMNAYIDETTTLNEEADRLTDVLSALDKKYGTQPVERVAIFGNNLNTEEMDKLIFEADNCADNLLE